MNNEILHNGENSERLHNGENSEIPNSDNSLLSLKQEIDRKKYEEERNNSESENISPEELAETSVPDLNIFAQMDTFEQKPPVI